jgi:uncharacterized membrane protein
VLEKIDRIILSFHLNNNVNKSPNSIIKLDLFYLYKFYEYAFSLLKSNGFLNKSLSLR